MQSLQAAPSATGLEEGLADYLLYLEHVRHCSPRTLAAYRADARHLLQWMNRDGLRTATTALDQPLLLRYLGEQRGLAANTVRRRMHSLSGWFRYLVRQGVLSANPAEGLPLPRRSLPAPRYPTPAQTQALLAAASSPLERVVIWLLAAAGLRRAELLGIDLAHLAEDLSELAVLGKGNRHRTIPLPTPVRPVLEVYLEARGRDPGPLLLNRVGQRLGVTSLRRIFARLVCRAGLEEARLTPHSLRHAYATTLVRAGVNVVVVRDLLGHADLSVTSRYLHSDLGSRRAAVERLALGKTGGEADE